MYDSLNANLGHIIVIEEGVGQTRNAKKEETCCDKEKGAEICPSGRFGDSSMNRNQGCILDCLAQ